MVHSTNTREAPGSRTSLHISHEGNQAVELPTRLALANDMHAAEGGYHDFLQVEEARPEFGLQQEARRDELSPGMLSSIRFCFPSAIFYSALLVHT